MRTASFIALLVLGALFARPLQGQVRGDSIFPNPVAGSNAPAPAATNSLSVSSTNTAAGDRIGFDQLAGFPMKLTADLEFNTNRPAWADAQVNAMIPTNILALDSHRVSVDGFMVPLQYGEKGKITEFMLTRDQATCCFGATPRIHEWISVTAKSPGVNWISDVPARVRGVLHVGAARENGWLSTVYRMDAETVAAAPEQ